MKTLLAAVALIAATLGWAWWMQPTFNADFSAYWSAGRASLQGRHPYREAPILADGKPFPHAGFLYPPSSLTFFAPLAAVPYHQARIVWLVLEIAMLAGTLWLAGLSARAAMAVAAALLAVAFLFFFPLFAHLERGQADLFTLFFIALGWRLWLDGRPLPAGMALAAAAVVKPPVLFVLVVPMLERAWRVVAGTGVGVAALTIASLAFVSPALHREYWTELFPALGRTGGLPFTVSPAAGPATTLDLEGRSYTRSTSFLCPAGSFRSSGTTSLGGAMLVAGLLYWRGRKLAEPDLALRRWRWITAMLSVLLLHPKTWLMAYVWLVLPAVLLWTARERPRLSLAFAVAAAGVALLCVGDRLVLELVGGSGPPRVLRAMLVHGRTMLGGLLLWVISLSRAGVPLHGVADRA